jgi:hypothetical protein
MVEATTLLVCERLELFLNDVVLCGDGDSRAWLDNLVGDVKPAPGVQASMAVDRDLSTSLSLYKGWFGSWLVNSKYLRLASILKYSLTTRPEVWGLFAFSVGFGLTFTSNGPDDVCKCGCGNHTRGTW